MHLLRSLLFIVPLTALTLALPSISSSINALQPRDDANSDSVPSNGVSCSTVTETTHTLDNATITAAVTAGAKNQFTSCCLVPGNETIFYPKSFTNNQIGTDPSGNAYTINWPSPLCAASALFYVPVSYPGFSAPAYWGGASMNSPPTPASPISSDIVVFVITTSPNAGSTPSAQFCAVLTNSDAATSDLLYVGGQPNSNPSGYHQCNPNQ